MLAQQAACYTDVLLPQLAEHGIHLVGWNDLTDAQRDEASSMFEQEISPVLDAAQPRFGASISLRLEPVDVLGVPARRPGER